MDKNLLKKIRQLLYKNGSLLTLEFEDKSTLTSRGYRKLSIDGKGYLLHRLIWYFFHGEIPKVIDHINGDVYDNRIENLKNCDQKVNIAKSKLFNTNKTGYKGVHFNKNANKYESYFCRDYKKTYCGFYSTAEEAYEARMSYLEKPYATNHT